MFTFRTSISECAATKVLFKPGSVSSITIKITVTGFLGCTFSENTVLPKSILKVAASLPSQSRLQSKLPSHSNRFRWSKDINFAEETVRLYTRKGKDGTEEFKELTMTEELYESLMHHKQFAVNNWVFCDPQTEEPYLKKAHWLDTLCKRAGVKPFGMHAIRHLTANVLLNQGV